MLAFEDGKPRLYSACPENEHQRKSCSDPNFVHFLDLSRSTRMRINATKIIKKLGTTGDKKSPPRLNPWAGFLIVQNFS